MLEFVNSLREVTILTTLLKLVLALLCGSAIGIERSYRNRAAGLRTHVLVCVGATIASLTGLYMYLVLKLPTDMSRIAAQVVAGLGFVGAGTIYITRKNTVKGLTTAAGLWSAGIIGLAIGAGFYEGAILGVIIILLTETILYKYIAKIPQLTLLDILVSYNDRHDFDNVLRYLKDQSISITNLHIANTNDDNAQHNAIISVRLHGDIDIDELVKSIDDMAGIVATKIA